MKVYLPGYRRIKVIKKLECSGYEQEREAMKIYYETRYKGFVTPVEVVEVKHPSQENK